MLSFKDMKKNIHDTIEKSAGIADKLDYDVEAQRIREILENFDNKELLIVVAGEAKRGKSSLLNALLGEKEPVFPVDINVCTNVVTVVRYAEEERVEVLIEDPDSENGYSSTLITRSEIEDYVSEKGNPENFKNVALLNVSIPNDYLKDGVVFVDTPGVGSLNIAHAETTYSFLPQADLLLFVSDSNSGLTESELNFLKRGYQYCKNIIFPFTKIDLNPNYPDLVEDNRTKIAGLLEIPEEEISIIPVNSRAKLRYLENGKKSFYRNSNFEEFEKTIWERIAKGRSEILLLPYLRESAEVLEEIEVSIEALHEALRGEPEKSKEYIRELKEKKEILASCESDSAEWRVSLGIYAGDITSEINKEIKDMEQQIKKFVEDKVSKEQTKICNEKVYTEVLGHINQMTQAGVLKLHELIQEKYSKVIAQINASLNITCSYYEKIIDKLQPDTEDKIDVQYVQRSFMQKMGSKGKELSGNTIAGGAIGGTVGAIVGTAVGFMTAGPAGVVVGFKYGMEAGALLGSTGGTIKSAVDIFKKHDNVDVNTVKNTLIQYYQGVFSGIRTRTSTVLHTVRDTLIKDFEKKIKERKNQLAADIRRLEEKITLSKEEKIQVNEELKKKLVMVQKQLTAIAKETESIRQNVIADEEETVKDIVEKQQNEIVQSSDTEKEQEEVSYGFL